MKLIFLLASASLAICQLNATPNADGIFAVFDTSEGEIIAKLHFQDAPISCANFIGLAEGAIVLWNDQGKAIKAPFYDGLTFHLAVEGFIIQGGDPLGNSTGGPGYSWPDEVRPYLKHDKPGTLSMANSGPNTNGSQFFFTLDMPIEDQIFLDGKYNVFGETVQGLDTIEKIGKLQTNGDPEYFLDTPVSINTITIVRNGEEAQNFNFADHLFPERAPANTEFLYLPQAGPTLRVHSERRTRYVVKASDKLESWSDIEFLAGNFNSKNQHDFSLTSALKSHKNGRFLHVSKIQGHLSEDRSGGTLTITSDSGEYVETIELNPGFIANYSAPGGSFSAEYDWFHLAPNRDQIWIFLLDAEGATPEIQFHLHWTSKTAGTVLIRDATPDYDIDSIEDFIIEGTFTYQE